MNRQHVYKARLEWTGNKGNGTSGYKEYDRSYIIKAEGKPYLHGSSDPVFRGDKSMYNPEDLLLASLSACHMLWFLHFCSDEGIIVTNYTDHPSGTLTEAENGSGKFIEVILSPEVTVKEERMIHMINALHEKAHQYCFISNSVNFPVVIRGTGTI